MKKYSKVTFFTLNSDKAELNLALEDNLFRHYQIDENELLFLVYVNDPSVVVGHFQNPFKECHLEKMDADNVKLVRRLSGGGTVFHDKGNLNFSFIQLKNDFSKEKNGEILLRFFQELDLIAEYRGKRSDVFIEGKKITGSAFKNIKDRSYHHGTVLVESDLKNLMSYLKSPHFDKIKGRGIPSNPSPVTSLKDLGVRKKMPEIITIFKKILKEECTKFVDIEVSEKDYQNIQKGNLTSVLINKDVLLTTPLFQFFLSTDDILTIDKGKIEKVELTMKEIHPSLVEEIQKELMGKFFSFQLIKEIIEDKYKTYPMYQNELKIILKDWNI